MLAGEDDYDGVPYADLVFDEVDWSEAAEHIRGRDNRKGRPYELNIEPEWEVLGWSTSAPSHDEPSGQRGRLVKVIVAPKDHPPAGRWWGATAMDANNTDRKRYEEDP